LSSNPKTNCYGLASECRVLYFSSVECREPEKVGMFSIAASSSSYHTII